MRREQLAADQTTVEVRDTIPEAELKRGPAPRRPTPRRYQTGDVVGRGGMGEVVSARDRHLGRDIAVKRMLASDPSERSIYRFLREARVQARLDHPAIVPVYDVGRDSHGRPYFTMKKVNGTTLAELLRGRNPAPASERVRLLRAFVDVCLAVELAHTRGVVHRDLKPENLLLGDFGEVYVLDWGVARIIGEGDDFADVGGTPYYSTADGAMLGTPGYMAPEQIRAEIDLDGGADVYSLGCVLFEILTGATLHPSGKAGLASTLAGIDCRPSSRIADVPPELDELVVRATGERDERPTARELGERVQRFLDGDRDVARRQELARAHLARARVAYERGGDPLARSVAMREAGRALALDPSLEGAAVLVGRLMLEPPRDLPREVEAALAHDAAATNRSQARVGLCMSLGYLGFLPFCFGFGGSNAYAAVYAVLALVNCTLTLLRMRGVAGACFQSPESVAIRNAVMISMVGCCFSAFQVGPALAVVTTGAMLNAPMFQRPRSMAVLVGSMLAAVFLPFLVEAIGLVPTTTTFHDGGISIDAPGLPGGAAVRAVSWVVFTTGILAVATVVAFFVRRTERESRRRLQLQAWHLRQLVP